MAPRPRGGRRLGTGRRFGSAATGRGGREDRRGKRMAAQEPRTELEGLKIKMSQLEHELYMTQIERDLLKKVEELERRDASRK